MSSKSNRITKQLSKLFIAAIYPLMCISLLVWMVYCSTVSTFMMWLDWTKEIEPDWFVHIIAPVGNVKNTLSADYRGLSTNLEPLLILVGASFLAKFLKRCADTRVFELVTVLVLFLTGLVQLIAFQNMPASNTADFAFVGGKEFVENLGYVLGRNISLAAILVGAALGAQVSGKQGDD